MSDTSAEIYLARARDLKLARRALGGEARALEKLGERLRCIPRILAVLNRRTGSPLGAHDLDDLGQEVAVIVLRKLDTFAGLSTIESWAHRIAFLELMNRLRAQARERRIESAPAPEPEWEPEARAEPEGEAEPDTYRLLERVLDELGPPEADVVRLKHYDRLTFEEAARVLGISPNTAKSRYYRGLRWLRRSLAAHVQGGAE